MTKRKNITMSDEIAKWYEDKAQELGIAQAAVMTIALKQYIDQDKAMSVMENMKQMLADLQRMKQEQPKID